MNSLAAELLANLHTFLVVGPNHSGDDLVRFDERPASRAEAMVRQVVGSGFTVLACTDWSSSSASVKGAVGSLDANDKNCFEK